MMDLDEGDSGKVERLRRRAASLRQQIVGVTELIAPQQQVVADPVESATRRAQLAGHDAFRAVTREKLAAAEQGRPERRPFVYASGGVAVRSETECEHCLALGATETEAFLIHHSGPYLEPDVDVDAELAEFSRETGMAYRPAGG